MSSLPASASQNQRLNLLFFQRLGRLVRPYWLRKDAWKPWSIITILLLSSTGFALLGGYLSHLTADTTNALVAKEQVYWRMMIWMTFVGAMQAGATLLTSYIGSKLLMDWRQWLTLRLMDDYLTRRTYYEIQKDDRIDNPDQRIQEESLPFCETMVGIPQRILGSLSMMSVQSFILWQVSSSMFWAVLIFAIVNTLVTFWLYHPTVKQNWELTTSQAELRSGLMHLRNNAENIAFYQGEKSESRMLSVRLLRVARIKMRMLLYNLRISAVNQFMSLIFLLLPCIFIVPMYFSGHYEYGTLDQAAAAAAMMLAGLSVINSFIPTMMAVIPSTVRLAEIHDKFAELSGTASDPQIERIRHRQAEIISMNGVDLRTPGGELLLVKNISLAIAPDQHTVVIGQTGTGKSSLLRVLAGLWTRGQGEVATPDMARLMFIPQRPYMLLSDMRTLLAYPRTDLTLDDNRIVQVFEHLGRPDFIARHGGLDIAKDWKKVLSLGEQQLVAFARVFLHPPTYLFLDEATSALDLQAERRVYQCLSQLHGTTYISVGHRSSILGFHQQVIELLPDGQWRCSLLPETETSAIAG